MPVHGVCSLDAIAVGTTGEVLVVTDARRREVYWARYRDGVRIDGPAVNAAADVPGGAEAVAGSPEHTALFDLPRLAPVYPTRGGSGSRRSGLGSPTPNRWCRCICAGPTPSRRRAPR